MQGLLKPVAGLCCRHPLSGYFHAVSYTHLDVYKRQDQGHVFVVHLAGDGVAQALAVLMAGNAVQRVRLAVQKEALLGVNLEAAHAKAGGGLDVYKRQGFLF